MNKFEKMKKAFNDMDIDEFIKYLINETNETCRLCIWVNRVDRCNMRCEENIKKYLGGEMND